MFEKVSQYLLIPFQNVRDLFSFVDVLTKQLEAKASNIHIIGHSLGAHISGLIGQGIPDINRITGRDLHFVIVKSNLIEMIRVYIISFYRFGSSRTFHSISNFTFIQQKRRIYRHGSHEWPIWFIRASRRYTLFFSFVIPANSLLGRYLPRHKLISCPGQVDFYINGGIMQPGCGIESIWQFPESQICSHGRAHTYFIESIENPDCNFVASETKERAEKWAFDCIA